MTTAETRTVLTQAGEVRISFDEAGQNSYSGTAAAIRAFDRALLGQVNRYGIGVTLDSLQPDDLQFVAGIGSGLILGDPPALDEEEPPPMPATVEESDGKAALDAAGQGEGEAGKAKPDGEAPPKGNEGEGGEPAKKGDDAPPPKKPEGDGGAKPEPDGEATPGREPEPTGAAPAKKDDTEPPPAKKEGEGEEPPAKKEGADEPPAKAEGGDPPAKKPEPEARTDSTDGGDEGDDDDEGEDDGTDPEAEFEATPETDEHEVMDGDFPGHPFRGNQYRKASRESGAAVSSSIKAKAAEKRGDKKAAKSAHRGAYHAHMAAAEGATGKAKHYHRTMAKFHGSRGGVKARHDDVLLDGADFGDLRTAFGIANGTLEKLRVAKAIVEARALAKQAPDLADLWGRLSPDYRTRALVGAFPLKYGTPAKGDPNGKARALAAKPWDDVPEAEHKELAVYLRMFGKSLPKRPAPSPEPTPPVPTPEPDGIGHEDEAIIAGVKFVAVRRDLPRPHWTARVAETGEDLPQTYATRGAMWEDLTRSAAAMGDRWASQFAAPAPPTPTPNPEVQVPAEELPALAAKIAESMLVHGDGYTVMARDDFEGFKAAVGSILGASQSGTRYSVSDLDALARAVASLLSTRAPASEGSPTPADNALTVAREQTIKVLELIATGMHPDMLAPETADLIEQAMANYPDDTTIAALAERAVDAYSNGLMAATG